MKVTRCAIAMKIYTLEEIEDKHIGKIGTPERDDYEKRVKAEIEAYHVREALKQAKLAKGITQEEADEKMGICT